MWAGNEVDSMKRMRSVWSIFLCVGLMLGLIGCGGNNGQKTVSPTPTVTEQKTETTDTTAPDTEKNTETGGLTGTETASYGKVSVSGTDFVVDEKTVYMNGVNTPWDKWNDCGGSFNEVFWDIHFETLKSVGINSVRIWISCNGAHINITDDGFVEGPTDKFWTDLETLIKLAEKHEIYLMATLMSFDNCKDEGQNYEAWRKLFESEENMKSMVDNYVIPLCERFGKSNALWSIDLCNEPDWIAENGECGKIAWDKICKLFAMEAAAIHENSDVLVTIGFGMVKYNSDKYNGNYGSDKYLQSLYANENAYLDFYSPHFYEWEATWYGFPMDCSPTAFGLDGTKPAMIGEFPATGFTSNTKGSKDMTASECYINVYENGWNGIMAWTSNGVDDCGALKDFLEGAETVGKRISGQE